MQMWQISKAGRLESLVVFMAEAGSHRPVGQLTFEGNATTRLGRFAYADRFLRLGQKKPIDPIGLPLRRKSVSAAPEDVHLAFHDAGPDGWGKSILSQAFPGRLLGMPEFLALGGTGRTGNLAFGPTPQDGPSTWVPDEQPLIVLPESEDDVEALVVAAAAIDRGTGDRHHLQLLMRRSADVGGARPKARLRYKGYEWIAKFPALGDTFDDPRVEAACLDVAEEAGLPVPGRDVLSVADRSVLLVRRFDRSDDGMRSFAYLSAGTLLKQPSTQYSTRKTYVDIAVVARAIGVPAPEKDVFRRLLVNAYTHNTDDHLRNHAFIDEGLGWRLSPVFDVVPHPRGQRHVCAPAPKISPEWHPTLSFSSYSSFGLSKGDAETIQDQVVAAAKQFMRFMDNRGVTRKDRAFLAPFLPFGFSPQSGGASPRSVAPT